MRKSILGALVVGSLLFPAAANAGGWATAGLSPSQPPEGSGPGDTWVTNITVLQHGETPLAGVKPVLTLTHSKTGKRIEFPGRPTDDVGVYRVVAKLSANGTWDVSVYDGFRRYGGAQTHTFAPVTVGPAGVPAAAPEEKPSAVPAPAADDGSIVVWPLAVAAVAAALAAAVFVLLARRTRRKAPAAV